jgi:hypothetical protein
MNAIYIPTFFGKLSREKEKVLTVEIVGELGRLGELIGVTGSGARRED